jgi:hypothetical protein
MSEPSNKNIGQWRTKIALVQLRPDRNDQMICPNGMLWGRVYRVPGLVLLRLVDEG